MLDFYGFLLHWKPFECCYWLTFDWNVLNCSDSSCLAWGLSLTWLQIRSRGEVDFGHRCVWPDSSQRIIQFLSVYKSNNFRLACFVGFHIDALTESSILRFEVWGKSSRGCLRRTVCVSTSSFDTLVDLALGRFEQDAVQLPYFFLRLGFKSYFIPCVSFYCALATWGFFSAFIHLIMSAEAVKNVDV